MLHRGHSDFNKFLYHIHNPSAYSKINFLSEVNSHKWLIAIRSPVDSFQSWARRSYAHGDLPKIITRLVTMLRQCFDPFIRNERVVFIRLELLSKAALQHFKVYVMN